MIQFLKVKSYQSQGSQRAPWHTQGFTKDRPISGQPASTLGQTGLTEEQAGAAKTLSLVQLRKRPQTDSWVTCQSPQAPLGIPQKYGCFK